MHHHGSKSLLKRNFLDKVIMLFFLLYMITYHIFSYRAGYVLISEVILLALLLLILVYLLLRSKIIVGPYFYFICFFLFWSMVTYFLAPEKPITFTKIITITQVCIVSFLFYNYFDTKEKLEKVIKMITFSYIVLALYTIQVYGISSLIDSNGNQRIGSEISQENVLGMSLATGALLCFYYAYYKNKNIYYLLFAFLFMISALTGSRKALIIIFLGVIFLLFMKERLKISLKTFFVTLITGISLYFILKLPLFELVLNRMESFNNFLTGKGDVDSSALERSSLMLFGWNLFLNSPIVGYGYDSFRHYWGLLSGFQRYSHNNYIEMLVNGGIVAFFSFYGMYIYCLYNLIKMALKFDKTATLLIVILLIQLASDMAAVSYFSKMTFIYFAVFFAYIKNVNSLNRKTIKMD